MAIVDLMVSEKTKERFVEWLLAQGVSTLLLCAILCAMGYGIFELVPDHLNMIQEGYQKQAVELTRSLEAVTSSQDREREYHAREREMYLRMLGVRDVAP
jgi:hypothetical protein